MINFETENLIVFGYTGWAGGKFLINCLGLSDDAVLQDAEIAEQQLNGNLDSNDKATIIFDKLSKTTVWNDLGMGCGQLFKISNERYLEKNNFEKFDFHSVIEKLSNGNKKFFIVAHDYRYYNQYLKLWKNAKIIVINNSTKFKKWRVNNTIMADTWDIATTNNWYPVKNVLQFINNDVYFNEDATINVIQELYQILHLSGFNEEFIRKYYRLWIEKCQLR